MLMSLGMIALQAAISVGVLILMQREGFSETALAAGVAAALCVALAIGSIAKSLLARHMLQAPVTVWRWPLLAASAAAILVGQIFIRLPEWVELAFGIPAILATYSWVIWRHGFREEDRVLFRRLK
jgi:peptidoglycan biosynthesis protein MviN/MurJ (putative lipid II flippase)